MPYLKRFYISEYHAHKLMLNALEEPHEEVCGLLSGRFNWRMSVAYVERLHPIENVADNPQTHFVLNPALQVRTMLAIEQNRQEMVGIYHSHPHGPARPSQTDLNDAHYPDVAYVILFPAQVLQSNHGEHYTQLNHRWVAGCWQLIHGTAHPVSIKVT